MGELFKAITNYIHRLATYDLMVVIVEMLLIGLVVWWAVRFLRGTRGESLVKGVVVILVAVYLCILLLPKDRGWDRIEFLYGKFLLFAFVAVVVAFQPELRRALGQLGRAPMFGGLHRYVEENITALVESAGYLSRNKTGAIIAVERKAALGGLMESGVLLDAELTAGLLNTIFFHGTPLHDMGVIIQRGRVAAAGCQFPLAESEDVDASLGSRHRAALGLAQETDAVVIIVSEETGRISIAADGQLHIGLDADNLRELLRAMLMPRRRKWLPGWITSGRKNQSA
ncbi:MAG: diadenylate cyclase [Planctomycetota bacterium]|nr:diadenylate cyclase [Planctomycetota bacterium]